MMKMAIFSMLQMICLLTAVAKCIVAQPIAAQSTYSKGTFRKAEMIKEIEKMNDTKKYSVYLVDSSGGVYKSTSGIDQNNKGLCAFTLVDDYDADRFPRHINTVKLIKLDKKH